MNYVWMLSKFYDCECHGWIVPVCSAYGASHHCPRHPATKDDFALVEVRASPHHVEAAKQDPRIVYCGRDYDAPPAKLLEVYRDWLDPNVTYAFMGQVIARLAEREPTFYHKEWGRQ